MKPYYMTLLLQIGVYLKLEMLADSFFKSLLQRGISGICYFGFCFFHLELFVVQPFAMYTSNVLLPHFT